MKGIRLPDVSAVRPEGWERFLLRDGTIVAPPGAYMKILNEDGSTWCWYARAPNGDVASIGFQNHTIQEHNDGTITVSPSIVFPQGGQYHGYLQQGIWS